MDNMASIDSYVFETLMTDLVGHDRKPSAYLVYLAIWASGNGGRVALSHAQLAEKTGLSKRSVQNAVAHLVRRELLKTERAGLTDTPRYLPQKPWRRWMR